MALRSLEQSADGLSYKVCQDTALTEGCQAQHDEGGACHGDGCVGLLPSDQGMNVLAGWGEALSTGGVRQLRRAIWLRIT